MDKLVIERLQSQFDALSHTVPDESVEFWFARELQEPLGYVRWENFLTAINRAIESCATTGYDPGDHFRGVTKMVKLGSGAERAIEDFMLTRPKALPPEENIKKLERRVKFAEKRLEKKSGRLPEGNRE